MGAAERLALFIYVLGPSQTHSSPRLAARAKMSLRRAQNIFMPKNINSITINITLEGIEEIKTENNDNKTLRRIFFSPALWENVSKL